MTPLPETIFRPQLLAMLWLAFSPFTVAAQQPATIGAEQTCLDAGCHANVNSQKVLHKPASKATTCKFCHKASAPGQHEFSLAAKKNEICTKCHKMVTDQKSQHMPAKRGMCLNCHDPHQSDSRNLLKKNPAGELCKGCHRGVGKEGNNVHGPVEKQQCTMCHNPHASDEKKLLKAKQPELCLKCHKRPLQSGEGQPLPATGPALQDEALVKHMPFRTGRCSMCHVPHSSDNYRLLKKPYPSAFYAEFDKDAYFCFGCHKASAFAEPRTLDATEFRNGNLNLHYRHVNREKGRTCRACHDHHAGAYPKLIRERVPFGQRFIEISEFSVTESGGSCAPTCHLPVSYDRWNPVSIGLKMTPREGDDASPVELQQVRPALEP